MNNNNIVPTEKDNYICIPAIDIDSVLKNDKKAYPQAYLEECKYKLKNRKLVSLLILKLLTMIVIVILIVTIIFQYQIVM